MKIYDENSLYDELVSRYDLDISDISSYFKMYDVDAVISKLNRGKITIDSLYDGMAQWLGIANIFESTDLNEGWSTGSYPWQTPEDVREALKYDEISSDYEFIKNFGNFFCYKRKKDGRPIVSYYLIRKMGREYGYKDIGLDSSTKYNPSVANWLKAALIEYGSTEENPGDFKQYWYYINSGTQAKQEKKEKEDIKSKLKPGSKVQMQGDVTVIYVRPYNNQAFAGHVDGETKLYKWYYRNIQELISESWNTTNINESTSFTTYLKEAGFTLMEYQEQVYQTCLAKGNYTNIDLYFADEIEQGYNDNKPVNEVADDICNKFDEMVNNVNTIEVDEPEYTQEQLQAFADYPQDRFEDDDDYDENASEFNESTEQDDGVSDGESYNEWKTDVFKYIDKRLDVNKIKELGSYIKDFIKQEYDNGEPSWFMCAESIVNYARIKYPEALKNRESNSFNITESSDKQVYVVTFETEDEANEQEYELRDGCGSIVDTALDGNKVYIIPNNRAGLTIIKDWFGDNAILADNADEIIDTYFNMNESVKNLNADDSVGMLVFRTEDGAYDAIGAWEKMKKPSLKPLSAFDPATITMLKEYNTYKSVDAKKLENKIQVSAPTKKLLMMAMNWLTEVDEDAVSERIY